MEKEECIPITQLGRLVKDAGIKSLEEICPLPAIREPEITDPSQGASFPDEVSKMMQPLAGQRSGFKASVTVGAHTGAVWGCSQAVATTPRGATIC